MTSPTGIKSAAKSNLFLIKLKVRSGKNRVKLCVTHIFCKDLARIDMFRSILRKQLSYIIVTSVIGLLVLAGLAISRGNFDVSAAQPANQRELGYA